MTSTIPGSETYCRTPTAGGALAQHADLLVDLVPGDGVVGDVEGIHHVAGYEPAVPVPLGHIPAPPIPPSRQSEVCSAFVSAGTRSGPEPRWIYKRRPFWC